MKNIKIILISLLLLSANLTMNSCSKKCDGENPRARVFNNSLKDAKVHIETSGGNTINLNNIAPGSVSDYGSYAPGIVEFTITVNNVDYKKSVSISSCFEYDIAIDANYNVTVVGRDRND